MANGHNWPHCYVLSWVTITPVNNCSNQLTMRAVPATLRNIYCGQEDIIGRSALIQYADVICIV